MIAPVTTIVGLGLFERGFPGVSSCLNSQTFDADLIRELMQLWQCVFFSDVLNVPMSKQVAKCVEIGIPALLLILLFSTVSYHSFK